MEIYLVRHGQTDYNLKGIVQGRGVNSDLNAKGHQQALAFYESYKDHKFDRLYTSAQKRTHQTMQYFIKQGIDHFIQPELDEINWGIYEGIMHDETMKKRYLDIIEQWRSGDLDIKIDGGESAQDLANRQVPWLESIKQIEANRILVCSHGRSIRSLLCLMTGTPLSEMDDFSHSNTCLYKVKWINDTFEIKMRNNTEHLNF